MLPALGPIANEQPGDTLWDSAVDASCIAPRLWQGSVLSARGLRERGFDTVCLCAGDFQPDSTWFGGLQIIRARLTDGDLTPQDWHDARDAGKLVAQAWREGKRVLVACLAGHNRSGLVMALALSELCRIPMVGVVDHIRRQRFGALQNGSFRAALYGLRDDQRSIVPPLALQRPG